MKQRLLKFLTFAASLSVVGAVWAGTNPDEAVLKEIAGYRQWTRVTPKPFPVEISSAVG